MLLQLNAVKYKEDEFALSCIIKQYTSSLNIANITYYIIKKTKTYQTQVPITTHIKSKHQTTNVVYGFTFQYKAGNLSIKIKPRMNANSLRIYLCNNLSNRS